MRRVATLLFVTACLPLAACGEKQQSETKVQMKDMEVVDGTATDAMTDLDGVQSEGTAVAMPTGNASAGNSSSAPAKPAAPEKPAGDDAEVVADQ
ncbi:hypothetical protein ACFOKF_15800 [Sphingobium rhizovicinum]|uniref:Secreted protein n=1 Tax=Sphingobium rhizovicinum TaxID=432308 RepID=A0ABV7NGN2_9SPHN